MFRVWRLVSYEGTWFPAIPFALFIFCFDETRKALMRAASKERTDPVTGQTVKQKGWLERNFAY